MQESAPYRLELRQYAESLRVRQDRQVWRQDSLSKVERILFVGFFFVRRLIECRKVTDSCARSSVQLLRSTIDREREVSDFKRDDLFKDLDSTAWVTSRVDVHQLADKVMHAWWFVPVRGEEGRGLNGFILTTDRKRNAELWWLPIESVIEVFDRFADQSISELHVERSDTGKLTYWHAR